MQRRDELREPTPNGTRARSRKLLIDNRVGETFEASRSYAERWIADSGIHAREMRARSGERGHAFLYVDLAPNDAHYENTVLGRL
jgi:hypothetical protein